MKKTSNLLKQKSLLTLVFSVLMLSTVYGQTWTGTAIEFNDPVLGGNSDYTAIYRTDVVNDRTRLRIRMGDEYTSDLEVGYHLYSDGNWYTTFSVDGWGNSYHRGYVGIGTTTLTERLNVNGKIVAEEVKVVVDVAGDYVFEKDYSLPSLDEVQQYIIEHKHLPGIPSAKELKENYWHVGDMSNKMLVKIEELTLYILEQNQKILDQQQKIMVLEEKVAQLEKVK